MAGVREDEITASTLKRVEVVARKTPNLNKFGKSTVGEGAIVLDLGEDALPELHKYIKEGRKDWKARFWAVDMLGYVGGPSSVPILLSAAGNRAEKLEIRARARSSLREIAERYPEEKPGILEKLRKVEKRVSASRRRSSRPSR